MTTINLLPWRAQQRLFLKRQFLTRLIVSILCMVFLIALIHIFISQEISSQKSKNKKLETRSLQMDAQTKQKKQWLFQIRTLENLEKNRSADARFFEELARIIPQGVYLTHLNREGNDITLQGKDAANTYLSHFIQQLEKSELFSKPEVKEIKTDTTESRFINTFILHLKNMHHEY